MTLQPTSQLLDIPALAEQLNSSVRHIRRLVAEQRIPYIKVGHFIRFDPNDVQEWLNGQRVPTSGSKRSFPLKRGTLFAHNGSGDNRT